MNEQQFLKWLGEKGVGAMIVLDREVYTYTGLGKFTHNKDKNIDLSLVKIIREWLNCLEFLEDPFRKEITIWINPGTQLINGSLRESLGIDNWSYVHKSGCEKKVKITVEEIID